MDLALRPSKALVNCLKRDQHCLNWRKGHCTLVKPGGEFLERLEVGCRFALSCVCGVLAAGARAKPLKKNAEGGCGKFGE